MLDDTRTATRWWASRPFLIIIVAGGFHFGRGAPVDGAVFLATAAALAFAETRPVPAPDLRLPGVVTMAALPLGWVISTWRPGTVPVAVAVALTGPPMLYLALATPQPRATEVRPGWWLWALTGVLVCLWELTQFLLQPDARTSSWDHPTLSAVLDPLFQPGPGRALLVIVWLACGVLLARTMIRSSRCAR